VSMLAVVSVCVCVCVCVCVSRWGGGDLLSALSSNR
jgi:preprotein translocase subunit SecG